MGGLVEGWKKYLVALAAQSALAACPLLASEPATQGDQPDLNARMNSLQAELDNLKAQQQVQQQQAAAREQEYTLKQAMDDADHRSKMLDVSGFSAGYKDNRFFIGSDDGNFNLRPWYHIQIRNVTLDRQNFFFGGKGKDEIDNGFEIRRMKIGLDGNMFSPDFTYFFNWATSRASSNATVKSSTGATVGTVSNSLGGVPILEEAWVKYRFHNTPFYIKAGQLKDPLLHDQVVSSRYQQSAERSLTADVFANGDAFTEGATFIYDPKTWIRTEAGVNHGMRSANTNFFGVDNGNAYNFGVAGRAEFKMFGRWQDYAQVGAVDVKEPLWVVGVGTDFSERGHSAQTVAVADTSYADPSGLNFYGAYVNRYTTHNFGFQTQSGTGASIGTPDPAVAGKHTDEYSILGEAGYIIDKHWEPFGRFEIFKVAGTAAGSRNYFQVLTGGLNYYFVGHRAKITAEIEYLPNGIPFDDGASDIYTSAPKKGEIMGEIQFQLLL
jgi:hypothetical protein